jgi:phosphoglycolate phosphatase-like HAD superfamily hydrolase
MVVANSPHDAEGAGKIGIRRVGLRSGGFPEEQLWAAGYVAIYNDCADLLKNYNESPLTNKAAA